ncbi:hypothetical protein BT93_L0462 [Corymbia citriodora subsp. variegata]|uniref:PGG domain-containing protein n=1 Tax=Corymbia citriodora subsp. variegata TaxID=360336 RepID=A0A8T0CTJ5_CORYI|nr:hypothetical protein BT93_L0462 [Corymbia citriodora subsp. variegata]
MPKAVVNKYDRLLFEAAVKGDWRYIEKKLNEDPAVMTAKVMTVETYDLTMLDVAIMAAQDQLVEELVKRCPPKCEGLNPDRALCYAARGGRIRMVKALLDKVNAESTIIGEALAFASVYAPYQKEVLWYLARRTIFAPEIQTMVDLVTAGHLDICIYLARKYPDSMAFEEPKDVIFLAFLATMTRYFRSGARLNFWEKSIYKFIPLCLVDTSFDDSKNTKKARALLALNRIKISLWNLATIPAPYIKRCGELKLKHKGSFDLAELALTMIMEKVDPIEIVKALLATDAIIDAASHGVIEIVELALKYIPELMWDANFVKKLIEKIVEGCHVELFRLISEHSPVRCLGKPTFEEDRPKSVVLMDAVAKWSPRCVSPDVSGAAFLLQRELQWFHVSCPYLFASLLCSSIDIYIDSRPLNFLKAVELYSAPALTWLKFGVQKKTYWENFVERRNELHQEAQKWMKDTSSSCSLVATLITTVTFTTAFTVPGGNDNSTGIPIFLKNGSFMVFAVADALALLCSITATLMFLAILTSRFAIKDFLHSLPRKMILGLTFLFLSLAFMLVAFGSALTIVLSERLKWIYIPITLLAAFPVVLFAILQLPMYIETVESTFWPRLYRPRKVWK